MYKYLKYFQYLFRHKWFVFLACCKYGLYWQGIVHDWSKFLLDELIPYADYFYGGDRRKDRFYSPEQGPYKFNVAWMKHQHRNPHHWQHWVLQNDDGTKLALEMPKKYAKEMICDWIGAGQAQGFNDTASWYLKNKDKMILANSTRLFVELELGCRQ